MSERTRKIQEVMGKEDFEKIVALYSAFINAELNVVKDALWPILWELKSKYDLSGEEWREFRDNEFFNCINVYTVDQEAAVKAYIEKKYQGYQA